MSGENGIDPALFARLLEEKVRRDRQQARERNDIRPAVDRPLPELKRESSADNRQPVEPDDATRVFKTALSQNYARQSGNNYGIDPPPGWEDTFHLMTIDEILEFAAHYFGLSVEELSRRAGKDATQRSATMTEAEIKAAKDTARLAGLKRLYEHRLETINLPPVGFTDVEQAKVAGRLSTTFRDLQKLERKLGRDDVTPKDPRVTEAERLKSQWDYAPRRKGSAAGRPRRAPQGEVTRLG